MSAYDPIVKGAASRNIIQRVIFLAAVALMAGLLVYAPTWQGLYTYGIAAGLADGEYLGTGHGFQGPMELKVTVYGRAVTQIEILSVMDDAQFYDNAMEAIIPAIINNQTLNVDTVTGATYSSQGILEGVTNALAGGR